jgi:hypothetical protein
MNASRLAWLGLSSVSVHRDEVSPPQNKDKPGNMRLSVFTKFVPAISQHLVSLNLDLLYDQAHLRRAMALVSKNAFPRLVSIAFTTTIWVPSSSSSEPVPEDDMKKYGRILSSLPALRELSAPGMHAELSASFLTIIYCHMAHAPPAVCINPGDFIGQSDTSLTWDPFALRLLPDTWVEQDVYTKQDKHKLRRFWLSEFGDTMFGPLKMTMATTLHFIAARGATLEVIERAFEQNGDDAVNLRRPGKESFGLTPLHVAIGCKRADVVRLFLEKFKPDLSVRCFQESNPLGYNALELACAMQLPEVVRLLVSLRREHYQHSLSEGDIFRLYILVQDHPKHQFSNARPINVPGKDTVELIRLLDNILGSRFPLTRLRDPISGKNLLHKVRNIEALDYFVSRGVDLCGKDYNGFLPLDSATDAFMALNRDKLVLKMLLTLDKSPLLPNTLHIRCVLRALGVLRSEKREDVESSELLMEMEKNAWQIASKEDIEAGFWRLGWEGGSMWETDLPLVLEAHFSSQKPFLSIMKQKGCRFTRKHSYCIEGWIADAITPKKPQRPGLSHLDALQTALYAIQTTDPAKRTYSKKNVWRPDVLSRVCALFWKSASDAILSEQDALLLQIAHALIDGYARMDDISSLVFVSQNIPGHPDANFSPIARDLKTRIINVCSKFGEEDEDLTETLNALVRRSRAAARLNFCGLSLLTCSRFCGTCRSLKFSLDVVLYSNIFNNGAVKMQETQRQGRNFVPWCLVLEQRFQTVNSVISDKFKG